MVKLFEIKVERHEIQWYCLLWLKTNILVQSNICFKGDTKDTPTMANIFQHLFTSKTDSVLKKDESICKVWYSIVNHVLKISTSKKKKSTILQLSLLGFCWPYCFFPRKATFPKYEEMKRYWKPVLEFAPKFVMFCRRKAFRMLAAWVTRTPSITLVETAPPVCK